MATFWQRIVMIFRSRRWARRDRTRSSHQRVVRMVEEMAELVRQAKLHAAQAASDARRLEQLRDKQLEQADEWARRAAAVVSGERENLAVEAVKRELALRQEAANLQTTIVSLNSHSDTVYENVQNLDTRLQQARAQLQQLILRESSLQARGTVEKIHDQLLDPWQAGEFERLTTAMDHWDSELELQETDRDELLQKQLRLVERHLPQIEQRLAQLREIAAKSQAHEQS